MWIAVLFAGGIVQVYLVPWWNAPRVIETTPERPVYKGCELTPWGEYKPEARKASYPVCVDEKEYRDQATNLMNHMELQATDDWSTGNEYGSNAQIVYFKKQSLFCVNPKIVSGQGRVLKKKCSGKYKMCFSEIVLSCLSRTFLPFSHTFLHQDALNVQCAIERLSG